MENITEIEISKDAIVNCNNGNMYYWAIAVSLRKSGFTGVCVEMQKLTIEKSCYFYSNKLIKWMRKLLDGSDVNEINLVLDHENNKAYI